eukprot:2809283-Amphidinium_carterae.3
MKPSCFAGECVRVRACVRAWGEVAWRSVRVCPAHARNEVTKPSRGRWFCVWVMCFVLAIGRPGLCAFE